MENIETVNKNDVYANDLNDSDSNDEINKVPSAEIYEDGLESPILGKFYRVPYIPNKYIKPTILDTTLPHIPVYTHLKVYDLKPIVRPPTPPILSELRSKCLDDGGSCKSSKAVLSTGRSSKGKSSMRLKEREMERSDRDFVNTYIVETV